MLGGRGICTCMYADRSTVFWTFSTFFVNHEIRSVTVSRQTVQGVDLTVSQTPHRQTTPLGYMHRNALSSSLPPLWALAELLVIAEERTSQ